MKPVFQLYFVLSVAAAVFYAGLYFVTGKLGFAVSGLQIITLAAPVAYVYSLLHKR